MSTRVPAADAQVRRVQSETQHADRWRRLCDPETTGLPISDLAEHHLGIARNKLYESFSPGDRHARLAWLELLPAQAELSYLRERAQAHGYELASATLEHATLSEVTAAAGRAIATFADATADGHLSPSEAQTNLAAIERLDREMAKVRAMCLAAIERRGLRVQGR